LASPQFMSADTSDEQPTLAHVLSVRARQQPQRTAYVFLLDGEHERVEFTYAALELAARKWAAKIATVAEPGDRILLVLPPGLDLIAAFYGALYGGFVAVPAYPPRGDRQITKLKGVAANAKPSVMITAPDPRTGAISGFDSDWSMAVLTPQEVAATAEPLPPMDQLAATSRPRPDSIAMLQYTSGATGEPRGVMLTHGNLMHNSGVIAQCFEHTPDSRGVIWLPPYHDMGLIGGILQPMYVGFPVVLMSPLHVLQQPVRWLRAVSEWRATTSGGPDFAFDLCADRITAEQRSELDLSSWQVAFTGAEPVRARTLERFGQTFAQCGFRSAAWLPCYGLAEATLMVSGKERSRPASFLRCSSRDLELGRAAPDPDGPELVGCGPVRDGQHLLIVNPHTRSACPDEHIGEIWVTGPSVASGYWGRAAESEETFAARLADAPSSAGTAEGAPMGEAVNTGIKSPTVPHGREPSPETPFLRTGDLGFLRDGELFVTGRLKELIIIAGRNHYPQDLERTVENAHPMLQARGCIVFCVEQAHREVLVAVAEVKRTQRLHLAGEEDEQAVLRAVRSAVAREHDVQIFDLVLVRPASLPRTSSGKLRRRVCRQQYLDNALQAI
jgi:acyl-CoA synthetase (AMP-forming)/AMP-acid ligase II